MSIKPHPNSFKLSFFGRVSEVQSEPPKKKKKTEKNSKLLSFGDESEMPDGVCVCVCVRMYVNSKTFCMCCVYAREREREREIEREKESGVKRVFFLCN